MIGSRSWTALGMRVEVLTQDPAVLRSACTAVERVLTEVDATLSRFRADSELTRVNQSAGRRVRVSPLFGGTLMAALRGARRTGGAVDPTIGAALRRLGYDRDFELLPARGPIVLRVERVPGWQAIEFDALSLTLRVPPGVELDLNCTGKAVAVDLAAEAAHAAAGCGVLVGIGGDLRCAGPAPDEGWHVLACEDSRNGPVGPGQTIAIQGGALATSSTMVRRWRRGDQTMHHLVDPATGRPAEGPLRTATVAASTCVDANLLATWALIRGDDAMACLRQDRVPARLIQLDGSLLYLGGWPLPTPPPWGSHPAEISDTCGVGEGRVA